MDILIKNMEMPKQCWNNIERCPSHVFDYRGKSHCELSDGIRCLRTKRPKGCPLVEVVPVELGKVYPADAKFWVEAITEVGASNGSDN